jgi:glutathione S-transferase
MITLYAAGPNFGLPDPSPFVTKADVLLKMSGVPYETNPASFTKAPKGKIPYIDDDGKIFGDSTFIRFHLEEKYGADFEKGLNGATKAVAWAFEKMCEEHLYFAILDSRWMNSANFDKGPRAFFSSLPAPVRPLMIALVRRSVAKSLYGHGMGRHSKDEIARLAIRDLDSIAAFLGDRPWLVGTEPCGADASVWAMVTGALCPHFKTPIRTAAESHKNLVAYRDRGMARWYPEIANTVKT